MEFFRKRILLVSSLSITALLLIGIAVVAYEALTIRQSGAIAESWNALRSGIGFAVLAFIMIAALWVNYYLIAEARRGLEKEMLKLEFEVTHDALTGLRNRRYLYGHLEHTVSLAIRYQKRLALMVIDLDGFKEINDTYGHNAGDTVLIEVARRLKQGTRASDLVARTGGDEFVVVAENVDQLAALQYLAQRLVGCFTEPIRVTNEIQVAVGGSIGIAVYPDHADSLDVLFTAADSAMYAAKQSGKNCWRMVVPG